MQPYPFTNERIEELEVLLQKHVKQLTEQHVRASVTMYNKLEFITPFLVHTIVTREWFGSYNRTYRNM